MSHIFNIISFDSGSRGRFCRTNPKTWYTEICRGILNLLWIILPFSFYSLSFFLFSFSLSLSLSIYISIYLSPLPLSLPLFQSILLSPSFIISLSLSLSPFNFHSFFSLYRGKFPLIQYFFNDLYFQTKRKLSIGTFENIVHAQKSWIQDSSVKLDKIEQTVDKVIFGSKASLYNSLCHSPFTDWLTHSLTDLLTHWLTDSFTMSNYFSK